MTTANPTPTIYQALGQVMRNVSAIAKLGRNSAQGFAFRGIDQVYDALHGPLADAGVVIVPEVLSIERSEVATRNGGTMSHVVVTVKYHFTGPAGDEVVAVVAGEAADSGDKAISKAMSMAFKYAAFQVLCIPLGEKDADAETHEFTGARRPVETARTEVAAKAERTPGGASVKAVGLLRKLGTATPEATETVKTFLAARGVKRLDDLDGRSVSELIDTLKGTDAGVAA
jgi:hypothetical protein